MEPILGLLIGAALGAFIAWRRRGNSLDMLHFAGVFAMVGFVLGFFVGVVILPGL